jgi:hypothetical protein
VGIECRGSAPVPTLKFLDHPERIVSANLPVAIVRPSGNHGGTAPTSDSLFSNATYDRSLFGNANFGQKRSQRPSLENPSLVTIKGFSRLSPCLWVDTFCRFAKQLLSIDPQIDIREICTVNRCPFKLGIKGKRSF